jgi:hypothetical protein
MILKVKNHYWYLKKHNTEFQSLNVSNVTEIIKFIIKTVIFYLESKCVWWHHPSGDGVIIYKYTVHWIHNLVKLVLSVFCILT